MTDQDRKIHPTPVSLETLAAALRDEGRSAEARLQAVRALRQPPREAGQLEAALALLIEVMGDDDYRVRKEALEAALSWPSQTLITERLVDALGEEDNVGRRNAAVEAVTRLGAAAVDPLLRALAPAPEHRKVLVDVLGAIGDSRAAAALAAALGDPDPNVRAAATESLGNLTTEEVAPALMRALEETDQIVVLGALEGLNRRGVALPMARLQGLLDKVALRPVTFTALSVSRDPAALPLLLAGLLDRARGAREAALCGVVRLHDGQVDERIRSQIERDVAALPELTVRSTIRALLEAEPPARGAAAILLGWSGRRDVVRPLVLALGDSHREVSSGAARAVASLGGAALESLCEILPELDGRHRAAIFSFFADIGEALQGGTLHQAGQATLSRVQALLCDGLSDRSAEAAQQAARALRVLGGREALAPLLLRLEGDGPVAEAAAEALGQLGRRFPEEVHGLISARVPVSQPQTTVPPSARWLCQVLGACGSARDLPALLSLLRASDAAVRGAAANALAAVAARAQDSGGLPAELWVGLRAALRDSDPVVRRRTTLTLGGLRDPQATALLLSVARDLGLGGDGDGGADAETRAAAVAALGQAARATGATLPPALHALRELAAGEDAVTAVAALHALARRTGADRDEADQGLLVGALSSPVTVIAAGAAAALGERGGEVALSALLGSLSDGRPEIREAVAAGLLAHGEREPLVLGRITAAAAARRTTEQDPQVRQQIDLLLLLGKTRP